jgi:hypothetical protein
MYHSDESELKSGGFTIEDADLEESDEVTTEEFDDDDFEDIDLYELQDEEEDK